ncbi:hypothetical protein HHI36_019915 [Cryptolaemus montrouzieri]|uniref:Uncharacterized protein n=1 Tax=Cryptolaemus montrouzieri TaxID=559131 RepID=A0ABD2N8X4_9CUCU
MFSRAVLIFSILFTCFVYEVITLQCFVADPFDHKNPPAATECDAEEDQCLRKIVSADDKIESELMKCAKEADCAAAPEASGGSEDGDDGTATTTKTKTTTTTTEADEDAKMHKEAGEHIGCCNTDACIPEIEGFSTAGLLLNTSSTSIKYYSIGKMLQNWATYLLGSMTNSEEDQGATTVGVRAPENPRLTAHVEDDWVLVDRDSEGNSDDGSSIESFDVCSTKDGDGFRLRVLSTGTHLTRTSSTSSLPCTSNMEESWFLTPPPCFTSTGPIHMETSPLENLLIEHPSMSVYQRNPHHIYHHHRRHAPPSVRSASVEADVEDVDDFEVEDVEDERGEHVAIVRRVSRIGVQLMQLQERELSKNKQAQKTQIQKASQPLKRAYLERNNKAREVNCRNRRQRRGEKSQGANRSHANNNRKC